MGKNRAWTAALLALLALGILAGILTWGRRSKDPTTGASTTQRPSLDAGLPREGDSLTAGFGGRAGNSEGSVSRTDLKNPAVPDRLDAQELQQEKVPREPRAHPGDEDPSLLAAAGGGQTFKLSGTVSFGGPPPKVKVNRNLASDPMCAMLHAEPPSRDDFVVSPEGGVRWAFVYIKKGLEGRQFLLPALPVTIHQEGCTYTPHVVGMMVGQALVFHNSDPLLHNVHGLPFSNREFNFGQPRGAENQLKLTSPEIMVKVICDIHPFMGSWVGVLDHPFFAVTDGFGHFAIPDVPAGKYTLAVWHEKLRFTDQELVLTRDRSVDFTGGILK